MFGHHGHHGHGHHGHHGGHHGGHHHHGPHVTVVRTGGGGGVVAGAAGFVAGAAIGSALAHSHPPPPAPVVVVPPPVPVVYASPAPQPVIFSPPPGAHPPAPAPVIFSPPPGAHPPASAPVIFSPPPPAAVPAACSPYELINNHRTFALVSHLGPCAGADHVQNGVPITLRHFAPHSVHNKWTITSTPEGHFFIHSAADPRFVLHQHGGSHEAGGPVSLWDRTTHGHQANLRVIFENQHGAWIIRFVHSGKCLDAATAAIGVGLRQVDLVMAESNKWRFVPC